MDGKTKRSLKARAHNIKPRLALGLAGVTPEWLAALDRELEAAELIKVRLPIADRDERRGTAEVVARDSGATIVGTVGMVAILYRRRLSSTLADF